VSRPDAFVPVAIADRSGFDESVHFGAAVVVDADGAVLFQAGDPDVEIYPRSSMKPVQADAMLSLGFTATSEQLALACASHDGTPRHLAVVRSILAGAGLDESVLGNTPDWPLDPAEAEAVIAAGAVKSSLFMNCSGKHAAMVACCVANGWPTETYLHPSHPLQRRITERAAELMGAVVHIGVDGCGAPAHAVRLRGLASAFTRLARERTPVWEAMNAHPELVGGERMASARLVAQLPNAMAKEGAQGVFAAALPEGVAVAVKISDGAGRASGVVAAAALSAAGISVDAVALGDPILGHGGPVGRIRPLFGMA
jgi:L-asparaginase II